MTLIALDRQFAVAAVNQDGKLHAARPSVIEESVKRSADGAARVKYIIAENHVASLHIEPDGAGSDHGTNVRRRQIVAVKLDVECARIHRPLLNAGDELSQPLRQRNPTPFNADQGQVLAAITLFRSEERRVGE